MNKNDEKGSGYKNLRVDEESYNRIDFLSKKEGVSKLSCVFYMTRFFVENGISFMPGRYRSSGTDHSMIKEVMTDSTDRMMKLIKWMEKEYFKPLSQRMTLMETDTTESLSFLRELSNIRTSGIYGESKDNINLTDSIKYPVNSISVDTDEKSNLSDELKDMRILKEKAELRLKGALEFLERSISPAFCTLLEEGEFGARNHKYSRADVEEIKNYIRQCTSI